MFELLLLVIVWWYWRSTVKNSERRYREISARLSQLEERFSVLQRLAARSSTKTHAPTEITSHQSATDGYSAVDASTVELERRESSGLFPDEEIAVGEPVAVLAYTPIGYIESAKVAPENAAPGAIPQVHSSPKLTATEKVAPATISASMERAQMRWQRIEKLFIENWTGILGAAIVVAGTTFLGIYSALKLAPFYRFLMLLGVAAMLAGVAGFLQRRETWQPLSQWVRSAAAAICLFACAAAGGLPGLGLQWIDDPMAALAILLLGLALNLYLAWVAKTQQFASLHVILGLLPLSIVQQSTLTLGLASSVAVFGVMLAYRARWNMHLLVTLAAYFLHQAAWYLRMEEALALREMRLVGVVSAFSVFLPAALAHYRKIYASSKGDALSLAAHLGSWGMFALAALAYHASEGVVRSMLLGLGGIAAGLLARRALLLGMRWLNLCDTLIGQALVVAAILSLTPVIADLQLVLLTLFIETLVFLRWAISETDETLGRVGWFSAMVAGLILAVQGMTSSTEANQVAFVLLVAAAATTIAHLYLTRNHLPRLEVMTGNDADADTRNATSSAMGWLVGMLVTVGLLNIMGGGWMESVALGAGAILLQVARQFIPAGLAVGAGGAIFAAHLMSWSTLISRSPWEAGPLATHIVPLTALSGIMVYLSRAGLLRQGGIYLFGANAALAAYLFFAPVSPLIPAVAWLLLSLLALEFANRIERADQQATLFVGYACLALFVAAYALVIVQAQEYLGIVPVRLLIELFGLGVILYWWFFRPHEALSGQASWLLVHPLFVELGLIAAATINVVEVQEQWRPATWMALSFALLAGPAIGRFGQRMRMYSLIFFWVSVGDVAIVMSAFETPSPNWYDRPDIVSFVALLLQAGYLKFLQPSVVLHSVWNLSDYWRE